MLKFIFCVLYLTFCIKTGGIGRPIFRFWARASLQLRAPSYATDGTIHRHWLYRGLNSPCPGSSQPPVEIPALGAS